jgi:KDO2-lipid IV(A) lauroyltransferase
MQALPVDACSALGALLSERMGRRAYPEAEARARDVIARVRPDLAATPDVLDATSKRLWEGIGRTHAEFAALERIKAAGRVAYAGEAELDRVIASGEPLIGIFLHTGNWEIAGLEMAARAPGRAMAVFEPPTGAARRAIANSARVGVASELVALDPLIWTRALAWLRKPGGILWVAGDEARGGTVGAPFFGRPAHAKGNLGKIALLALRTNAWVSVVWCERHEGARFTVTARPPMRLAGSALSRKDVLDAVVALDGMIAEPITRLMDQWYMAIEYGA